MPDDVAPPSLGNALVHSSFKRAQNRPITLHAPTVGGPYGKPWKTLMEFFSMFAVIEEN